MSIKQLGRQLLGKLLAAEVKHLRATHKLTVVAVVGSVGKTTTKTAIAELLSSAVPTQYQAGNYNDLLTAPLVFFGLPMPSLYNPIAWLKTLYTMRTAIDKPYPYKVVVVELGTDGPGQLKDLAYIKPDIVVVTALTPEHMVNFKTLDAVAAEELTPASWTEKVLINTDDADEKYLKNVSFAGYGKTAADYVLISATTDTDGQQLELTLGKQTVTVHTSLLGGPGAKAVLAAAAVGDMYGLTVDQITTGVASIQAVPGRMQILAGRKNSVIIDDSYNASPVAVKAALDELYAMQAPQRIALLGSMNEMGTLSPSMHEDVGRYCDASKLDLLVTLGADANKYLAPVAEQAGCRVQRATSPQQAGKIIAEQLKSGAAVLVKGSQNRVFSEEAIKSLLANPADVDKLVRQSKSWLRIKKHQFGPLTTPQRETN